MTRSGNNELIDTIEGHPFTQALFGPASFGSPGTVVMPPEYGTFS
jgi:hypothetical protein